MKTRRLTALTLALSGALACESSPPPVETPPGTEGTPTEWKPSGPQGECNIDALLEVESYGAKVKTLLTGLPLTDAELKALQNDPDQLASLIDEWLLLPESDAVLQRFFMTAFQQTTGTDDTLFYLLGRKVQSFGAFSNPKSADLGTLLNQDFAESFGRTMVDVVKNGAPFSEAVTTDEFMMTTAQMAFLAFVDDEVVDDFQGHTVRTTTNDFDTIKLVRDQADAPPASEALDPTSPQFATFWQRDLDTLPEKCGVQATQTIDTTDDVDGQWKITAGTTPSFYVFSSMMGRNAGVQLSGEAGCNTGATQKGMPLFDRGDFSDWHKVKVRKPNGGERPTVFYDLPKLRTTNELVLHTERRGFLTTPGFFSTWMNNEDNSSRVTINQALIVALGKSFEGATDTDFDPLTLDDDHAASPECYACHQTLDPMRDFFRASFTNFYGQQLDPARSSLDAEFVFDGVEASGNGVAALSSILATHPAFPYAWAHKLCYFANSAPCVEGPELDAIVTAFEASDLDFRVLVRDLFSSPLVTGAACVAEENPATNASIARKTLFCGELSHRLGVDDICGAATQPEDASDLQNLVRDAAASIPDDGFSRAVVEPVVITETGLFTRANTEAACVLVAQNAYGLVYEGQSEDDATLSMVTNVMGLAPSDERHAEALTVLREHVDAAIADGKSEPEAVQSAFVLACMAPTIAGVGF